MLKFALATADAAAMTTLQYINFGDANPLDHGGFIVEQTTGQVAFFDGMADSDGDDVRTHLFAVHRTELDRVDADWIRWDDIAEACGWIVTYGSVEKARAALGPAACLQCAVFYYGSGDFDSSPDEISGQRLIDSFASTCENFAV